MAYKPRYKKYNNTKCNYNGYIYDSRFEASVAQELDLRLAAGDISNWDRQYKVEMQAYDSNGKLAMTKNHKIDFRVHELDGSYTLLEAKGFETQDYRERRRWLEKLWLPIHLDYKYEVIRPAKIDRYKR